MKNKIFAFLLAFALYFVIAGIGYTILYPVLDVETSKEISISLWFFCFGIFCSSILNGSEKYFLKLLKDNEHKRQININEKLSENFNVGDDVVLCSDSSFKFQRGEKGIVKHKYLMSVEVLFETGSEHFEWNQIVKA
jgi:hypothetical protein